VKWQNGLNPETLDSVREKTKSDSAFVINDGGAMASRVSTIYAQNPWLKPETILSLSRSSASPGAIEAAGYISGIQKAQEMPDQATVFGMPTVLKSVGKVFQLAGMATSWVGKGLSLLTPDQLEKPIRFIGDQLYQIPQDLKPVTRWGTAALDIIPEMANFAESKILSTLGAPIEYGQEPEGGFWESTSIGQLLSHPEDQGSGFFISETLRESQAREARARRGMISGSAFTIGRGAASLFFDTDSSTYLTASGIVDALQVISLPDPTKLVTKGIRAATIAARGGLVPLVSEASAKASNIDDWLKALQEVNPNTPPSALIAMEAGIKQGLNGPQVDLNKFTTFMRNNPSAKRLVNYVIQEDDAGVIFNKILRGEGTTDTAYNLSKAKTEDQVIASMLGAYTYGDTPISRNLGLYAPPVTVMKPLANLKELSKRSRLLSAVPDEAVVFSGDQLDNTKAVKNFMASLRTAGVPKEEVDKFATVAVNALRTGGSAVDRYGMDNLYNTLIEKTLTQNKVKKEVIDTLLETDKASVTMMRSYFRDRMGNNTDAGFMQALLNVPVVKASMQQKTWDDLVTRISTAGGGYGADLHFESAIQHTDLLNRMRVLPDHRTLRRLSRNPLFTRILAAAPGGGTATVGGETVRLATIGKLPILSNNQKIEIITNRVRYSEIDREVDSIKNAATALNKPLSSIELANINKLEAEKIALVAPKRVKSGEQRALITMVELLQNDIWKRMTLMTGGYSVRNMIDAQIRMTFAGTGSVIRHPLEYISLVIGKNPISPLGIRKAGGASKDILGTSLMARGSLKKADSEINQLVDELRDRISSTTRIKGMGSADFAQHLKGLGTFADVQRTMPKNGMTLHTEGVVQQLSKMHASPLSKVAARSLLTSAGKQDVTVARIVKAIKSPDNADVFTDIKKLFMNGIEESDKLGNVVRFPPVDIDELFRTNGAQEVDKLLKVYAEKIVLGNAVTQTGNVDSMRFMAGYDAVPSMINGNIERIAIKTSDLTDELGNPLVAGSVDVGQNVVMKDGRNGVVIMTGAKKTQATVVPVVEKGSLTKYRTGSQYAQKLIKQTHTWDGTSGLPGTVSREITGSQAADRSIWGKMSDHMDKSANWFFVSLNARSSRVLERSPVFRNLYYQTVLEHVDELSQKEAKTIISRLSGMAQKEGVSVEDFIGNRKLMPKLEAIVAKTNHTGNLGMANLDEYAKALSLNQMEDMLFDASNTNNLKDILRIVVPFGNAWSEVVGHYLSNSMVDGVHKYRTFQRFYSGAVNADPDQDGRGFFYKDAQTNELMFSFPMSSSISKIITGGDYTAGLSAPVKRLSQGINVYPGIGPFAQVVANKLISDSPKNDEIRALLLPYGSPKSLDAVLPGWAVKLKEALEMDQTKTTGVYANTYFETIKAEANTGMYDLSLPMEVERLKDNAAQKAKWLTMMRAASQFFGPTSGQSEFKIPTDAGDVYVREIVKEFHDMQMEDYDSAVERFLNLHGENAALYVSSKSKSNQPGLETTDDFNDWTRTNGDLINAYNRTANYLAPSFGEFDFKASERQVETGVREALNAEEMIALAQNRIGSSRYRAAKLALGAYPTKDQAARLAEYRVGLSEKYPGFKAKAEFVTNQHLNDLIELGKLVEDPRVAWNPAVPAIKQWLNMRQNVISSSGMKSLASKKLTSARADLFVAGESLAKSNPYFDRIWQRLLSQEVED
jgi:hypothetical protein